MPHSSNDPVVAQNDAFAIIGEACRPVAVQNETLKCSVKNAGNPSTEPGVLDKPFVTARTAAELIGVPEAVVVADIERGMAGALGTLTGGYYGSDVLIVYAYEVEGDRLVMHRKRLADHSTVAPGTSNPITTGQDSTSSEAKGSTP